MSTLKFRDLMGRQILITEGFSVMALDNEARPYVGEGKVAFYRVTFVHSKLTFIASAADWKASGISEQYND